MKKKLVAMAAAMVLCASFATQNVRAASCPPHDYQIIGIAGQYISGSGGTHKVYRNLYVDGQQAYSICTITYRTVIYNIRCMQCGDATTDTVVVEWHSLANDPDHK